MLPEPASFPQGLQVKPFKVVYTFSLGTQETKGGFEGQPVLQNKFQAGHNGIMRPFIKKKKKSPRDNTPVTLTGNPNPALLWKSLKCPPDPEVRAGAEGALRSREHTCGTKTQYFSRMPIPVCSPASVFKVTHPTLFSMVLLSSELQLLCLLLRAP